MKKQDSITSENEETEERRKENLCQQEKRKENDSEYGFGEYFKEVIMSFIDLKIPFSFFVLENARIQSRFLCRLWKKRHIERK